MTKVLQRFNMHNAKSVGSPLPMDCKLNSGEYLKTEKDKAKMRRVSYASVVGNLMYAMVCTRLNIAFVVGIVSCYMSNPGKEHWAAIKWILRHLKGKSSVCLRYGFEKPMLEGFTGDVDSNRSTSGYVMTYSGGLVSWQSRLQKVVALSTTEAEYITTVEAGKELIWMREFLSEYVMTYSGGVVSWQSRLQKVVALSTTEAEYMAAVDAGKELIWMRDF